MSLYNKIIDLQKLQDAWRQIYKNKPKEGVDFVTCEEFNSDKTEKIKELWRELVEHEYKCMPVQLVPIYKGEKVRYVSLYTMRDKVIQYSMARELTKIFEPLFSDCCYAYREGKSALHACQAIYEEIQKGNVRYAFRADIKLFFDYIQHDILLQKIREEIKEEDVICLLHQILVAPSLGKTGQLTEKRCGIYQGSSIAPVLSNIYMIELDRRIEQETAFYIRYSDDMLMLFRDYPDAERYCGQLAVYLEKLGLSLNEEKTKVVSLEDAFEFLGYEFQHHRKCIPKKAKEQLAERLETIWLDSKLHTIQERLEKGAEILSGWMQYYEGNENWCNILEYAVWIYIMEKNNNLDPAKTQQLRGDLENPYKDVMLYLVGIWKHYGMRRQELYEYEQYYSVSNLDSDIVVHADEPLMEELLTVYEKYAICEEESLHMELIQLYSDLKMYQKAETLHERICGKRKQQNAVNLDLQESAEENIVLTEKEMIKYMELFVGREDIYATYEIAKGNKRKVEEVQQPLLGSVVENHLNHKETVSTYIQRSNGTVKYLVLDLDISKGVLLQYQKEEIYQEYMQKCLCMAKGILKELRHMGLKGYLEQSGSRGYHIWIFFSEWIPTRYANLLSDILEQKIRKYREEDMRDDIQIEFFPNKTRVRNGKRGQCMKLPWGFHPKTGRRSLFLDSEGRCLMPQKVILEEIVCYTGNEIKRIISAQRSAESFSHERIEVDKDLREFGAICDSVRVVLESCNLIRYLCQKSWKTHYLTHSERLTILYVFGHMGENGKSFVHKIMSFTLNYSYQTTQRFILRCPEKPVSCLKLQEQYKQISAEIGCSCNFKRTKDCYPSPVLHALKESEESAQITVPVSRTISENKSAELKAQINITEKVQKIVERMLEQRKQIRSLEKALRKCEQELGEIFDDAGTDNMEIKTGMLTRRKSAEKEEWYIVL